MNMAAISPNATKVLMILVAIIGLLIYVGDKIAGQTGVLYGFAIAIVVDLLIFIFADKMLLKIFRAKEVYPDNEALLHATAAYLTERAEIPKPRLYVIEEASPNVFTVGKNANNAAIVVTRGLLKTLDKDELGGVIAHEVAHIQMNDILVSTMAASIGAAIVYFANFVYAILMFGAGQYQKGKSNTPIARMLISMLAPVMAILIQVSVVRNREFEADERGVSLSCDPESLVNALYKMEKARENFSIDSVEQNPYTSHLFIINPLHTKMWFYLYSTHPSINERIQYLEDMVV